MGPVNLLRKGRVDDEAAVPSYKEPKDTRPFQVSAVIPIKDRPSKHLAASVRFLLAQSLPVHEIIVVDQASKPELRREYASILKAPKTKHLIRDTPDQWNKPMAANAGIRATSPESTHILNLDCDMLFGPNALDTLRSLADKYGGEVLVYGHRHDLLDASTLLSRRPRWRTLLRNLRLTDRVANPWHFVPRDWIHRVRGYDERMWGRGAMDNDMTSRAERDPSIAVAQVNEKQPLAIHYNHSRPPWPETHKRPETALNCHLRNTDLSIVRNDENWGA